MTYSDHPFLEHPPATASTTPSTAAPRSIDVRPLPKHAVTNLDMDVTEACNLACVYCFKSELYGRHMSLDAMRKTFEWFIAASHGATRVNVNFMGGEPTMRWREIESFVPWARRRAQRSGKQVSFSMTSNLTLWTNEIRQFVDDYGFGVLMSIDGCPAIQDKQRPAKSGKKMSSVIEHWARSMLRTRPRSTARMTLHPTNIMYLVESIDYLAGIGFREITISASDYEAWSDQDFDALESALREIVCFVRQSYDRQDPVSLTVWNYLIERLVRHRLSSGDNGIERIDSPCGAGKGYMMVDYTGDIWPCHRFDGADTDAGARGAFRLGNIYTPGFNDELQRAFLEFDHSKYFKSSCRSCPVEPVCGGYCPAANLQEAGNIYTPHDNYCRWAQAMYRSAVSLFEGCERDGHLAELLDRTAGTVTDGR